MIVPETFNIGPFKIPVTLKNKMWDKEKKVGTADIGQQRIILQAPMPGCLNKKCVEQAFLHELIHMALFYAGQRELYVDEVLVDCLANLLYQFMETKQGDAIKKWRHNSKTRQT